MLPKTRRFTLSGVAFFAVLSCLLTQSSLGQSVEKLALDDGDEEQDAAVILGHLHQLGYLASDNSDPQAIKDAVKAFAQKHYEQDLKAFTSLSVLRRQLDFAAEEFSLSPNGTAESQVIPLIAQYRIGVSRFGGIRYVIGGCSASCPDDFALAKLNTRLIPSLLQRLTLGQEIFVRAPDASGQLYVSGVQVASDDLALAKELHSIKATEFKAGISLPKPIDSEPGSMVPKFDSELVRVEAVYGADCQVRLVGEFFPMLPTPTMASVPMRLVPGAKIIVCEVRDGASVDGIEILLEDFAKIHLPWEAALYDGSDRECRCLRIYRPFAWMKANAGRFSPATQFRLSFWVEPSAKQ